MATNLFTVATFFGGQATIQAGIDSVSNRVTEVIVTNNLPHTVTVVAGPLNNQSQWQTILVPGFSTNTHTFTNQQSNAIGVVDLSNTSLSTANFWLTATLSGG